MKCASTLFTKDGLKSNMGSYILLFVILLFAVSSILFHKIGYVMLENCIDDIIYEKENKKGDLNLFNYEKMTETTKNNNIKSKNIKKKNKNKSKKESYNNYIKINYPPKKINISKVKNKSKNNSKIKLKDEKNLITNCKNGKNKTKKSKKYLNKQSIIKKEKKYRYKKKFQ